MQKKTITIVICALNEEKNIGALLQDIQDQKLDNEFNATFVLERVYVVSDGSTDRTAAVVRSHTKHDPRIVLHENPKRIGKIFSLDHAFHTITSDYPLLFDADVRLEPTTVQQVVKPLYEKDYALVGGNPVPIPPGSFFNIAEHASMFSWYLLQNIKASHPKSIYAAHGRILLLSKALYTTVHINDLSTPGDDQFIYLKSEHNFAYEKSAIVHYRLPGSISDYLKQNVRFRTAQQVRSSNGNAKRIATEFEIPDKLSILLRTAAQHPFSFFWWALLYTIGYLKYYFIVKNRKVDAILIWGEVKSTK